MKHQRLWMPGAQTPCGFLIFIVWLKRCAQGAILAAMLAAGLAAPAAWAQEEITPDPSVAVAAEVSDLAVTFDHNLPWALALVFLIGLALNLTPCVYPMLAVTVSIFGGQTESRSWRVFGKALLYVLGMATMYSVLGVAAALTGGLFGGLLQSRAVLVGISLLFLLLALSMFGLYELRLPAALTTRLGGTRNAGLAGIYLSGLLVGVFAAPCIGPPIIALLALVGQRADPVFGFLIFFVLSLGLGAPYLALGTFSGLLRKMPRSGDWMVWVRKLMGFVLVGVAFFYLALAFRPSLIFVLIPLTLAAGGLYLGFLERTPAASRGFAWLRRIVGIGALVAGVLFFMAGRKPSLEWTPYAGDLLKAARRPAVLYFSADWCIPCLELDRRTFTDDDVGRALNRYALFKVDLTHYDSPDARELREQFAIRGVPTMVFLDVAGKEMPESRLVGFVAVADMLRHLERVRAAPAADPGEAAASLSFPSAAEPSAARLVADVEWIQPGQPFRAGVLFEMQDQWHVYWINPGDSGTPPGIEWALPAGFTAAAVQWPHPQRFDDPPFATFGHEGELLLAHEIQPAEGMEAGGTVTLSADADWLVCREICIPQRARVSLELDVRDEPPEPSSSAREAFERAAARIPVVATDWRVAVLEDGNDYVLSVTPPSSVGLETVLSARFFPAQPGFLRTGPYRWRESGESAHLPLRRDGPVPAENRLRGVLVLPEPPVAVALALPRAIVVDAPLPPASGNE